eukprot:TRINITY_DN66026_c11_g1_i1.p1 TRINITY_DN66026_c11_g1~~TRINITY_DN66026_c11_g1_i1.p1  ORF type:complete len:314 (+),score=141.46 TRINITY_DN66026_c11_g1_i1:47-943(+)
MTLMWLVEALHSVTAYGLVLPESRFPPVLFPMISWFLFWNALFVATRVAVELFVPKRADSFFVRPLDRHKLAQNFISVVHAYVGFFVAYMASFHFVPVADLLQPDWIRHFDNAELRWWHSLCMSLTGGYMAYDIVPELLAEPHKLLSPRGWLSKLDMIAHHTISGGIFAFVLVKKSGFFLPAVFELIEFTTPLWHIRWFLGKVQMHEHWFTVALNYAFLSLFVCMRGGGMLLIGRFPLWFLYKLQLGPAATATAITGYAFIVLQLLWSSLAGYRLFCLLTGRAKTMDRTKKKSKRSVD